MSRREVRLLMTINYRNRNLRPKTFYAKIVRGRDGTFTLKRVNVLRRKNQYQTKIQKTDARDFVRAVREQGIQVP
jgi:hypothetical protein